ncbi:Phage integrase [hydrothermal vent metagenome]|uniref:Phage integrase n=1 Tax=hydrothermal vent metagenome TaxID=652676 RepID=A0A3B0W1B8_9ZZZZ
MAIIKDVTIRNLKPKDKQYKFGVDVGLYLLVRPISKKLPNGSKLWQHQYRISGKRKVSSYGKYPDVSLSDVKTKYQETCKLITNGIDPMEFKKKLLQQEEQEKQKEIEQKELHTKYTFKNMAIEWHNSMLSKWSTRHSHEVMSSLNRFMFPKLGQKPMIGITKFHVMEILKGIEQRPNPPLTALRKVKQRVEAVFDYVIDTYLGKIVEINPVSSIKTKNFQTVPVQNLRALDKKDIPELMQSIDNYNGYTTTKLALKMLVYTFARHSELRLAKWQEIDWNNKLWTIPKERMKKRKTLVVPLSNQVMETLKELQTINGDFDYIFASYHKPDKQPMSENAILVMLKNINFWRRTTAHGMRALFSTIANHNQINPDWIERQLAHTETNKVRSAYNRSEYLPQRTIMMQWYANYIDGERIEFQEYFNSYNKKEKSKLMRLAK